MSVFLSGSGGHLTQMVDSLDRLTPRILEPTFEDIESEWAVF